MSDSSHDDRSGELRFAARAKTVVDMLSSLKDRMTSPWRFGDSLLEISRSIVEDVVKETKPIGRGKRVLAGNHLEVVLLPVDEEQQAIFEAALEADWAEGLQAALADRLGELGVDREPLVEAVVGGVSPRVDASASPYRLVLTRQELVETGHRGDEGGRSGADRESSATLEELETGADVASITLNVEAGEAEEESYSFSEDRILIGRLREVFDEHGRIVRINHIAFRDEGEENQTVSREHARIMRRDGEFWLVDERSAYGTRIFRAGRAIAVSSRDRRGVRLRHDDQINIGRAVLVCQLD